MYLIKNYQKEPEDTTGIHSASEREAQDFLLYYSYITRRWFCCFDSRHPGIPRFANAHNGSFRSFPRGEVFPCT